MSSSFIAKIITFVLYLGFMIFIGLRYAKKNKSSSDFFLGGRKTEPWMTALSAVASLISGGITVVIWHNLKGGIFDIYEILPGFIVCLIFTVVFSLLQKNKDSETLAEFDTYKKNIRQQLLIRNTKTVYKDNGLFLLYGGF